MAKQRLLTPTKITAWLDCAHYLTLSRLDEAGQLDFEAGGFGSMAQMLVDKGLAHENECLQHYRQTRTVFEVPDRRERETFAAWVDHVCDVLAEGHDVIYQMPFVHDGIRGVADFLVRVDYEDGFTYEPVDAKLARSEAKPGHILQLCFYAEAIEAATGLRPENLHVWLGSGQTESVRADDVGAYWRRLRHQLRRVMDSEQEDETTPVPCYHCDFCEYQGVCDAEWRAKDSLVYVSRLGSADRAELETSGIATMAELAAGPTVESIPAVRLERLVDQASLQVEARTSDAEVPPFRPIAASEDPLWGRGQELLPLPDEGDIFLDFEGHPFWKPATGLIFLFGYLVRRSGTWTFEEIWAHDEAEESEAVAKLIDLIGGRREAYPGMHVYHYNHTERSTLEALTMKYGVRMLELRKLIDTGCFVDLLPVVTNSYQVGVESYGLKHMERLAGYERGHEIDRGAGAVVEYDAFTIDGDPARLEAIASYNEDDVRATMALRDWLVVQRATDIEWRDAYLTPDSDIPELDEMVSRLLGFDEDSPERLLGHVLGYWQREYLANLAPKLVALAGDSQAALEHPSVLVDLECLGLQPRFGKNDRPLTPALQFTWPPQELDAPYPDRPPEPRVLLVSNEGYKFKSVHSFDRGQRLVELLWKDDPDDPLPVPTRMAFFNWVRPNPKPDALNELASAVLDPETHGEPSEVAMALLRRDKPRFVAECGLTGKVVPDSVEEMVDWVRHLDQSFVAVQGPPGTGKTWRGARMVHSLIQAGQRVGITAFSHSAIDNLLAEIVDVFSQEDDVGLKAVRRGEEPRSGGLPGVSYAGTNPAAAKDGYNLVAGTTWLFANADMAENPVDVLIIDEAGQLSLADALAACRSAKNLVLLGDPLQLPQVSQASHPASSGSSVLEHVLGDNVTIPPDRGVFLAETRRMHPSVCEFISHQIYEGRLSSNSECARQKTALGTGLRWLRADHEGCSTESELEAELIAEQIAALIGTDWVDSKNVTRPLGAGDFMVVAPYNDQVRCIQNRLRANSATRDVEAGTVDRFQGREAAVVFFSMASSSSEDMPRGYGFLFSRNRLNVAISRARCLAYLVCSETLLDSRGRSIDDMTLISTLCSLVEWCKLPTDKHSTELTA